MRIGDGDIFGLPKATFVILSAVVALAIGGCQIVLSGRLAVPHGTVVWTVTALWVAMVLCTITSTQRGQSLVGQYSQDAGLLQYTAYIALFLVVLRVFRPEDMRLLARAIVAAAAFVTLYAAYQWLGNDPVDWNVPGQVFSVMGNVDFLAGWCGCVAPLTVMLALWNHESIFWRVLAGVTTALTALAAYATHSFQGPMSVAAGVGLFVVIIGFERGRALLSKLSRMVFVGAAVVFLVLAAVGGPRVVSAVRAGVDNGLVDRRYFWRAAVETGFDHPVLGTGLDTFHNQYEPRRPIGQARYRGENAGAAHSVPLDMWANGGIVVLGTYLLFVGFTAWRLLVGLRQHTGDRRFLLAGFGSAWFGYQAQAAVSIDKPALGVLHFVLAAAVHVLAGIPEWRERRVLGSEARGRRPVRQADLSGLQVLLASLVLVLGLAAVWLGSRPFRADLVYSAGVGKISTNPQAAVDDIHRALKLNPTEARYTFDLSRAYLVLGDKEAAIKAAGEGSRLEPGDASYARYAGSVAANSGDVASARRFYDRGVKIDPLGLDALLDSAIFEAKVGEAAKAKRLVERALAITRDRVDVWQKAGTVYQLTHDDAGVAEATARLKELGA